MICLQDVSDALRPCLGPLLSQDPEFCGGVADVLQSFSPWKEGFAEVSSRLEDYLFNALYNRLGPGMTVQLADGAVRRIRTADLPQVADEALFPLFASLEVTPANYAALQAWWMSSASLSAMRALYLRFPSLSSPEERALMERIARETVPASRLAQWFEGS